MTKPLFDANIVKMLKNLFLPRAPWRHGEKQEKIQIRSNHIFRISPLLQQLFTAIYVLLANSKSNSHNFGHISTENKLNINIASLTYEQYVFFQAEVNMSRNAAWRGTSGTIAEHQEKFSKSNFWKSKFVLNCCCSWWTLEGFWKFSCFSNSNLAHRSTTSHMNLMSWMWIAIVKL